VTKVEAHTLTTNYALTCEATLNFDHPDTSTYCVQFETGVYQAVMVSPAILEFVEDDSARNTGKAHRSAYTISVEETIAKHQ